MTQPSPLFLGIDFGTSGARAIVINLAGEIQGQVAHQFTQSIDVPEHVPAQLFCSPQFQLPQRWEMVLWMLLSQISEDLRSQLRAIAINGTSSTVMLCDSSGQPVAEPLLYNDFRGAALLPQLRSLAPDHPITHSATSSLAKLLWWQQHLPQFSQAQVLLHQADWLAFLLHGQLGFSDYHNTLKLGYDVAALTYPAWLPCRSLLPTVLQPGTPIGLIQLPLADRWGIPLDCRICAGTTDSVAAFLASSAQTPGTAVTSLGSTIVLKLLSQTRVDHPDYGIYSHRLGDLWLVGGASNSGGAVLRHFFSEAELRQLSTQIQPEQASGLEYYPLLHPGERFPVNDPTFPPQLLPHPRDAVTFLHGLLEGMTRIESQGYQLLQSLGATRLQQVYTAGGGAENQAWMAIRARYLGVPVTRSPQIEAAYGTALLARSGVTAGLL